MVRVYRKDLETFYEVSEERAIELEAAGYSRDPSVAGTDFGGGSSGPANDGRTTDQGLDIAKSLYSFMPEAVLKAYADSWVKSGDKAVAIGMTRQTKAWKDNFGKLMRDDGSLVMDELSFMSVKASYKQTLAEVGVSDFTDFEDEFDDMATGYGTDDPVSAEEFQTRIDMVYAGVKDQIPQVEAIFRDQYGLGMNEGTIFAALINPDVQDKVLMGDISTAQIAGEARAAGFTDTFGSFEALRKAGLTQTQARSLYQNAGNVLSSADRLGMSLDLDTLESAAVGDVASQRRLSRLGGAMESASSAVIGAQRNRGRITGLIEE